MENTTTFQQRLRVAMAQAGIGVGELADRLHVTRQTVSGWRSGAQTPNLRNATAIERELDLDGELVDALVEDTSDSPDERDTSVPDGAAAYTGIDLHGLHPDDIATLNDLADTIRRRRGIT